MTVSILDSITRFRFRNFVLQYISFHSVLERCVNCATETVCGELSNSMHPPLFLLHLGFDYRYEPLLTVSLTSQSKVLFFYKGPLISESIMGIIQLVKKAIKASVAENAAYTKEKYGKIPLNNISDPFAKEISWLPNHG